MIPQTKQAAVLLIEDDPGARRLYEKTLADYKGPMSYQVESAYDLACAAEKLKARSFDSIVTDMWLPDSTGAQTVKFVRQMAPDSMIIAVSGLAAEQDYLQALSSGADYFLHKSTDMPRLLGGYISSLLERKKQSGPEHQKQDKLQSLEKQIADARKDFLTIFNSAPVMIWYRDKHGRILHVNKCAAESVGMSVEELQDKNYYDIFPEGQVQARDKDLQVILTGKAINGQVKSYRVKSGKLKWSLVDRVPHYDQSGQVAGVIVFAKDISELKLAEERLKEVKAQIEQMNSKLKATAEQANMFADQALEASRAKSEFLASMSHEIRTPLNSIVGFSEILSEEQLDQEHSKYVQTVNRSARILMDLVNDILDFSKIEAGRLEMEMMLCSPAQIAEDIITMLEPQAAGKSLDFRLNIAPETPSRIKTDPVRLRQCLLNLLSNALKFTEHGRVHVNIAGQKKDHQSYICFAVEDTGIGIAPEKHTLIFESFSQAGADTTRKYGGTGLGLAITKRLTALLGGTISLESEPGKGSTFKIEIPTGMNGQTSKEQPDLREFDEPLNTKLTGTVLLAQDDPSNRLLINSILTKAGLDVAAVEDGKQLVQKTLTGKFDCIVTDIAMSGLDGCEATKLIRSRGIGTPIIAVTADTRKETKNKCESVGIDEYLTKPIRKKQLLKILQKYLSGSQNEPPENSSTAPPHESIVSEYAHIPELSTAINEFIKRLPALIKCISSGLKHNDFNLLERISKLLADAGKSTGFPDLAHKANQLKLYAVDRKTEQLGNIVDDLTNLCQRIAVIPVK